MPRQKENQEGSRGTWLEVLTLAEDLLCDFEQVAVPPQSQLPQPSSLCEHLLRAQFVWCRLLWENQISRKASPGSLQLNWEDKTHREVPGVMPCTSPLCLLPSEQGQGGGALAPLCRRASCWAGLVAAESLDRVLQTWAKTPAPALAGLAALDTSLSISGIHL